MEVPFILAGSGIGQGQVLNQVLLQADQVVRSTKASLGKGTEWWHGILNLDSACTV